MYIHIFLANIVSFDNSTDFYEYIYRIFCFSVCNFSGKFKQKKLRTIRFFNKKKLFLCMICTRRDISIVWKILLILEYLI